MLVQLRYHEKYVSSQPNTVGNADQEISAAHCVREECVLSGMRSTKGRSVRASLSVSPLPQKILTSLAYMAFRYEAVIPEILDAPVVLDHCRSDTSDNGLNRTLRENGADWFGVFRAHLPQEAHILGRIVQINEAYFKGMALMMAKQKGTRKLAWDVISGTAVQRHHAAYFLFRKVRPGSKLWTDGAAIYKGIGKWWPVDHSRDIHKKFEFAHTSEIERMFGVYRTFVRRIYHHHWSINLEEYMREFSFRFSSPELFENPSYYLEKTLSLVPTC